MKKSRADIVVTIGPASASRETLLSMARAGADVARLNFAWGDPAEKASQIATIRSIEREMKRPMPIIADLPGPREQGSSGHTYKHGASVLTDADRARMKTCAQEGIEWVALSFVGSSKDVISARAALREAGSQARLIAKIERTAALDDIEAIIEAADAIMVVRGDLGNEIPLETVPFAQARIVSLANRAGKPVIVATEMLLSMKESLRPTRAETTDVANAILQGADAVMLSEETSIGAHPVEAVAMMERIVAEAERHVKREYRSFQAI